MIGQKLAHFTVLDRLGAGGMGEVYLARDEHLGREVALKLLPAAFAADAKRVARFHREAKLASQLSHPNIATIYDSDEVDGVHFIAMELVRGKTLREYVRSGGVSKEALLKVAVPLAEGLAAAHEAGVIHRDLKPGNVMVDEKGRVKILDFGLSRPLSGSDPESSALTSTGAVMGTPHYMAPEQMRGEVTDPRSDLFSLGVILYELATGERPFEGEALPAVMKSILTCEPTPLIQARPNLGELLGHTVDRLLQRDPAQRFQSAAGVAADLRSLKDPTTKILPSRRRRMSLPIAGALLTVVIGGLYALGSWPYGETAAEDANPLTRHPVSEAGRLKLALMPVMLVGFPEGDDAAEVIARMLTWGLYETLCTTYVDLVSPSYLQGKAKERGLEGDLNAFNATKIAREEGAVLIVFGTIEPGRDGLDLRCELLEGGTLRTFESVAALTLARVPACVDELAAAILTELGLEEPVEGADTSALTDHAEAYMLWSKGRNAFDLGDWEEAERFFRAAIELDPDFTLAYYQCARVLWWARDPRKGEEVLEPVLDSLENLSSVDREKVLLLLGLLRSAPDDGGDSLLVEPGLVERAHELARRNWRDKDALDLWMEYAAHHTTEARVSMAVEAWEALIALDPDHASAYFHWWIPLWAGRWDLVRKSAEFIRRSAPEHPFAPVAALIVGDAEEARKLARRQGLAPSSVAASRLALMTAFALDELQLAHEIARVGQERFPLAFDGLVPALLAQGRFREAQSLAALPATPLARPLRLDLGLSFGVGVTRDRMGALYAAIGTARSGDSRSAEEAVRGLDVSADDPLLRRFHALALGEIAYARGDDGVALEKFLEAAPEVGEIENEQVAPWAGLLVQRAGRALREDGQYEEAERWLGRFEESPQSSESLEFLEFFRSHNILPRIRAYWELAQCRDAQGDSDGALLYLKKFLHHWHEADPGFPEIQEARDWYEILTGEPYE